MTSASDLGINLDSAMKKLVKANFQNLGARASSIRALSICTENFIELLVQASASVCLEKDRNTMTNEHVLEAINKLGFSNLADDAKTISQQIEGGIKERNDSWKNSKTTTNLTEEEADQLAKKLHEEALLELKRKKQQEAALKAMKANQS